MSDSLDCLNLYDYTTGRLEPASVSEVHTVGQVLVLGEETETKLECSAVLDLVVDLECNYSAFSLGDLHLLSTILVALTVACVHHNEVETEV